ncbi:hypothetical protein MKX47_21025 [Solibacillus sp. FSL R7-0668]
MFGKKKTLEYIQQLERALDAREKECHRLANENLALKHELQKKQEPRYFA